MVTEKVKPELIDFKEELDRMLEAVDESLWCEIITDEEYTTLKNMIIHKTIKYV